MHIKGIVFILTLFFCLPVTAEEIDLVQIKSDPYKSFIYEPLFLASADDVMGNENKVSETNESKSKYKERFFTLNNSHKYLGLGSLGLATLAILSPKQDGNSAHHQFATGAAILGVSAVATGFAFHLNDIDLSKGFKDPDNLHMALGVLGALGYVLAVNGAPDSMHATYGTVGIASMLFAIKLTW